MNVLDYIAFKKQGLSAEEIRACMDNGIKPAEVAGILNMPDVQADSGVVDIGTKGESAPGAVSHDTKPAQAAPEVSTNEPDYKALYEAERAKLNKIQADNTRQPVNDKPMTQDEIIDEIVKKFY